MTNSTDVNTFMASVNWQANSRLSFQLGMAYSMAEMEMEDIGLPNVVYDTTDSVAAGGSAWGGEYNPSNVNQIESYSHLEYDIIDVNLNASYAITNTIGVTVSYVYEDVDDDQAAYVYGDEEGAYQSLMTYLTVQF